MVTAPLTFYKRGFPNLSHIPSCKRLYEPREQTKEALGIMNFLRLVEGLSVD